MSRDHQVTPVGSLNDRMWAEMISVLSSRIGGRADLVPLLVSPRNAALLSVVLKPQSAC